MAEFNEAETAALKEMVGSWLYEGFTTPPYSDEQYSIFEKLDWNNETADNVHYDIERPSDG